MECAAQRGYWSRVIALRSMPSSLASDVEEIVTVGEHVDLAAALAELRTVHSVRIVRVDSGGNLVGALMAAHLVDEISLLVHPVLVADNDRRIWWGGGKSLPAHVASKPKVRVINDRLVATPVPDDRLGGPDLPGLAGGTVLATAGVAV